MKPTRTIVITTPYFPPLGGGLERYAYEIAKRLHGDHDWRIVMITSGVRGGKEIIKKEVDGLILYQLPYRWKISNTPLSLKWFAQIKKILDIERPYAINIQMPVPGIGDITALLAKETQVIVTYHAGTMQKTKSIMNIPIWIYEHGFLKLLLRRADYIICSSDFVRDDFLCSYKHKSTTITPGVDMNRFRPGIKTVSDPTILFVAGLGRAEQHKGLSVLIRAFNMLYQSFPRLRLVVVGDGDMKEEYEGRVRELGLEANVSFMGRLEKDELVNAYQQADIFVLPSLSPAESFGMVLIEAMATGKAVIGSRAGGIPLVIDDGENGLLVDAGDIGTLIRAIKTLLDDSALLKKFGETGRIKAISEYNWDMKADSYNNVLITLESAYNPVFAATEK